MPYNKFLFAAAFILLIGGSYYIMSDEFGTAEKTTTVQVLKSLIDLKEVESDQRAIASFSIKNIGSETLIIDNIDPGCRCTLVEIDQYEVEPHDSVGLRVEYDKSTPGFFSRDVIVYANADNAPILLTFQGTIK